MASFAFYLITGGALIVFILASSLFIYAAGLWLERINQKYAGIIADSDKTQRKAIKQKMNREKKIVTGISASILIGVLLFLKYFNFFGSNINGLINNLFGLTPNAAPRCIILHSSGSQLYNRRIQRHCQG